MCINTLISNKEIVFNWVVFTLLKVLNIKNVLTSYLNSIRRILEVHSFKNQVCLKTGILRLDNKTIYFEVSFLFHVFIAAHNFNIKITVVYKLIYYSLQNVSCIYNFID